MAEAGPPQLPNPFTPMAFLPPDIAYQTTIGSYILVGTTAVFTWDILNNLDADYKLLFKYRINLPTIAYFVSRIFSLAYVLSSTIFETAPAGNCATFLKVLCWFYPVALPATSLLFFFRIKAIFDRNKYVVFGFFCLWLCVVGGCLTVTQAIEGINIGPTNYCLNFSIKDYVAAAGIIPLVHDTAVFSAITYRLMANSHVDFDLSRGLKVFLKGEYLPAFSRALFQDGQQYYLTAVSTNLLSVIMLYIYSVPVTYRTMFTVPNIMLTNVMACRVFRNTKFGLFREKVLSTSRMIASRSELHAAPNPSIPLSIRQTYPSSGKYTGKTDAESGVTLTVEVSKSGDEYLRDGSYDAGKKDKNFLP